MSDNTALATDTIYIKEYVVGDCYRLNMLKHRDAAGVEHTVGIFSFEEELDGKRLRSQSEMKGEDHGRRT